MNIEEILIIIIIVLIGVIIRQWQTINNFRRMIDELIDAKLGEVKVGILKKEDKKDDETRRKPGRPKKQS